MFAALIKKDLLLIRKHVALLVLLNVLGPFILTLSTMFTGIGGFFVVVSATAYVVVVAMGEKEAQYPRAASLLCVAPYSRRLMVLSKYVVVFMGYGFSCAAFWILSLIRPQTGGMTPGMAVMGFLGLALVVGIYLPLQFRFGYERARYLLMAVYIVFVCGMPAFLGMMRAETFQVLAGLMKAASALMGGAAPMAYALGLLAAGAAVLAVSFGASAAIYERLDLS